MTRNRMEAFSDGVLAIIITIMVLKLKTPEQVNLKELGDILPTLLAYVLSYVYIGIYWTKHHHLLNTVDSVSGSVLWKNLHWLFWMSLIPLATEWMGLNPLAKFPTVFYGLILFMCAVSYHMLQGALVKSNGPDSLLAKSIGKDMKGKLSMVFYAIGVGLSFVIPMVAYFIYAAVAILWIIPDVRLERALKR